MKEESTYENMQEVKEKKVDIQEIFFKYLIHWPWIVGAVILCVIVAWIYLRMFYSSRNYQSIPYYILGIYHML